MCERTCPNCGSTEHIQQYGMIGTYLVCAGTRGRKPCATLLANRRDPDAARTDMTEAEVEAWARAGSFVLAGAEANDPADDDEYLFRGAYA